MKKMLKQLTLAATLLTVAALPRMANAQTTYTDATGETVVANGILDISSVEVSNDSFDLIFKINVVGDIVATDWGKYMIGINSGGSGGASADFAGNGWGRPITFASGMNYWVGSWADGGNGGELWKYTTSWGTINAPTVSKTSSNLTIRVPYTAMGLSAGSSIDFDVYTSGGGGGDGAIDALSTNAQSIANWGDAFQTVAPKTYTLVVPPAPTNDVFFQVNMGVPINEGTFAPGIDDLYVRGNFNGWPANPGAEYKLFPAGGNVYTNTVKIVGTNGTSISYKFFNFGTATEEARVLSCNNDVRTATLNGTSLTTPLANWGDRSTNDPNVNLTFQADMTVEIATGGFTPGTDTVYARGTFNNWGNTPASPLTLTNIPAPGNTNIYVGTTILTNWPLGACIKYKWQHNHLGAPNGGYESGGDRSFTIASATQTNAPRLFNDVDVCDTLLVTNFVTFTVSLTNAIGTDNLVYDGTQAVYLNGNFANWWAWGSTNGAATNYLMSQIGGTSNYTITVPLPAGNNRRLAYKFSMNGADNEAVFGNDHVRYIRATPGLTTYTLPLDVWTGTNAVNIANRAEPKFGNLRLTPAGPGQVSVLWSGYNCVELQSVSTLTGGTWTSVPNTSGQSATNVPSSGTQQYFRLIDTSP